MTAPAPAGDLKLLPDSCSALGFRIDFMGDGPLPGAPSWLLQKTLFDIMISTGSEGVAVAQFIVRGIEEDVKLRLKRLAKRHGRSMEEEVRHILRNAARESGQPIAKLGSRIASRFSATGLTSDVTEFHGELAQPAQFER